MKKVLFSFSLVLVSLFAFCNYLSASDVSLKCRYKNPYDDNYLNITFTDEEKSYRDSLDGKYDSSKTCIDSDGTFGANLYLGHKDLLIYSYTSYSNGNWVFNSTDFQYKSCLTSIKSVNNKYTCPSLGYTTRFADSDSSKTVTIISLFNTSTCIDSSCTPLEQASDNPVLNIDSSGEVSDNKVIDTCDYDIKLPGKSSTYDFSIYSDGSINALFDGARGSVTLGSDPAFNVTSGNNTLRVLKDDAKGMFSKSGNKLACPSQLYVYRDIFGVGLNNSLVYNVTSDFDSMPADQKDRYSLSTLEGSGSNNGGNTTKPGGSVGTCVSYLGSVSDEKSTAKFLDEIWGLIQIGSIILVIVFSMIEFTKGLSNDKEKLGEIVKKTIIRLIVLAVILLLPTFIDIIGNLIGIPDILCGIK